MKKNFRSLSLFSTVLVTALSACGGDDAGTPSPSTPSQPPAAQAACRPDGKFSYSGSASPVAPSQGQLAVLVVPSLPDSASRNRNMTAPNAPASSQVQQSSGAFTTLAKSDAATECLGLEHGAVTEIQSFGSDVAIGRWNKAKDTDDNTYSYLQGIHYAVGTPLTLTATQGKLACTQLIADDVRGDDGKYVVRPERSTATLDLSTRTLNDLTVPFHSDPPGSPPPSLKVSSTPLNGVSTGKDPLIQTIVVGHDAAQPLVAVGYSTPAPQGVGFGGVVVLSCE